VVKLSESGTDYKDCPECDDVRLFEQPHPDDCPDTADGECPEWVCTVCGAALITAAIPIETAGRQPGYAA
jgi:hypothetical protein